MTRPNDIVPPKWSLRILRFFVKKEYLEEIEGDMEELFHDQVAQGSLSKARRVYTWEILKLMRPILIKNLSFVQNLYRYPMFNNYFKVSLRGLMKNPLNSFINLFGLAAAIGFCVFAYGFSRWAHSRDQFHKNKNEVFLVTFSTNRDGSLQQYGTTPRPLGEMLRQDFAHIKKVCRVEDREAVVKYEDLVFNQRIRFVDPEFLDLFTFPLKWGSARSLADVNSVILSGKMSIKYFGDQNPLGQTILIKFDKDRSKAFKVTGVAEAFPLSRSIDFSFLINYENFRTADPAYDFHDWTKFVNATLIQVDSTTDLQSLKRGMEKYKRIQHSAAKEDWAIASFNFEPLATLHERTDDIRDDIARGGTQDNYTSVVFLVVICVLLLALACFNYINIAVVSAAKRLKEIGVRKSIGATQRVVIVQFLTENIVITSFALVLGVIIGWFVVIPWFENLWDFSMGFTLNDAKLWIYLPAILLFTGIASGIYPAFYISRFQAVSILKGSVKFGQKNPLTQILLGIQLVLSSFFITSAIMFTQNTSYLAQRSWGYGQHDALYAVVPDRQSYEQLHDVMMREPNIVRLSGSRHHLGKSSVTTVIHFPEREYEVDQLSVDPGYFETMGLELQEGRKFNDHERSDQHAIIVNEFLVKNLAWENPIGKTFKIDSLSFEVIGVVKDFHYASFSEPIKPTIFRVADREDYRFLTMKIKEGSKLEAFQSLQAKWSKLFPEVPFDGGYQEDVWGGYFEEIEIYGHVWRVFATLAVILATLGLYGLVTLNVSGRTKEFSIRKVLGARLKNIAANVTRQYLALFLVALLIGTPLSYIFAKVIIEFAYKYHMPITLWQAVMASIMLIILLLATVSTQIIKVSKANPVNGLKTE